MLFKQLLLVFFLLATLSEYAAAATLKQCKKKWRLNNITTSMSFGTFSIEVPAAASTITLTGGGARTSTGSIDLVSGSAINSHQLEINNTESFDCGVYGITIDLPSIAKVSKNLLRLKQSPELQPLLPSSRDACTPLIKPSEQRARQPWLIISP